MTENYCISYDLARRTKRSCPLNDKEKQDFRKNQLKYLRKVRNLVDNHCTQRGWSWHPQAPQMPHMNVLDLAVFPAMSKRHISMCRDQHGLRVLKPDEIWTAAAEVWDELPCHKIAQAFVQANRIAKKVIKMVETTNSLEMAAQFRAT